jgi:hypothetical protein
MCTNSARLRDTGQGMLFYCPPKVKFLEMIVLTLGAGPSVSQAFRLPNPITTGTRS